MRKYWMCFKASLQKALTYRARIATYTFINIFSPIMMLIVWYKYYQDGHSIAGFTYESLIVYYLATILVSNLMSHIHRHVSDSIQSGDLSKFITKPISFLGYMGVTELGYFPVKILFFIVPFVMLLIFFGSQIHLNLIPALNLNLLFCAISIVLAYILSYLIAFFVGSTAFFFTNTTGIENLSDVLSRLISGQIFPIAFFPLAMQKVINFTPYIYTVSFPVKLISGNYNTAQALEGLGMQVVWIAVLYLLYRLIWKIGIRKYTAVGI